MSEQLTLDKWVARFPRLQLHSRELWMAIRWEFEQQKPPMTVRQMFYRMASKGMVAKTERGYRQVQYALTAMRRAGAIPYGWLADNTRWVSKPRTYRELGDALTDMQTYYRRALWANQAYHVEIWLEKDALRGVVGAVTTEYDVPLYVTRGYPSLSYLHEAAVALRAMDKNVIILHLGDYDASGQDAARTIDEGLRKFGARFSFYPIAVTRKQIHELNLQTRPAKKSDPRAARHGDIAVELDAIPPATLRAIVRGEIERWIDPAALEVVRKIEAEEQARIADFVRNFGSSTKTDWPTPT